MTLQFQINEQDYRQANAAVRAQKLMSISTLPVFYVFLAFSVGTIVGNFFQPQPPGASPRGVADVIISSFPLLLISAYWGIIALRTRGQKAHGFVTPPPPLSGLGVAIPAFLCIVVFILTVACIIFTPVVPDPPSATPPPRLGLGKSLALLFFPFMPSVAMVVAAVWMVLRLNSRNITRAFELLVNLRVPHTVQISPEMIVVSDEMQQTQYQWTAFIGWHETQDVIILYRSYISFEMIPKRAFSSFEQMQQFLDLLRQKIGQRQGGFDTIPAQVPAITRTPEANSRSNS